MKIYISIVRFVVIVLLLYFSVMIKVRHSLIYYGISRL